MIDTGSTVRPRRARAEERRESQMSASEIGSRDTPIQWHVGTLVQIPRSLEGFDRLVELLACMARVIAGERLLQEGTGEVVLRAGPGQRHLILRLQRERVTVGPAGLLMAPLLGVGGSEIVKRSTALDGILPAIERGLIGADRLLGAP